MSKKLVERTIKVASVSMAAVMAATPMTAFAADGIEGENPQQEMQNKENAGQEKKEEVATIENQIADAKEAAVDANNQMAGVESFKTENNVDITVKNEDKIDPKAGEDELDALAQDVKDMKDADQAADGAENANVGLVQDASDVASGINSDMTTAATTFGQQVNAMNSATTIPDAQAAYTAATQTAANAQTAYNNALTKYNGIQDQIKANNKVIADAEEAYQASLSKAKEDQQAAYDELEAARQVSADLETAANAAAEELKNAAAARIIAAQAADEAKNKLETRQNKVDWNKKADVMTEIMGDYFIPVYLGGKDATVTRVQNGEDKAGKALSKDGNAHFYIVTYTNKEGEEVTEYYNYKLDENGDLIIFKKSLVTLDIYRYMNEKKQYVEVDPEDEKVVDIDGTKYYLLDDGEDDVQTIISLNTTVGNTTVTAINNETSTLVDEYIDEDGNVVRVTETKGDVTKVTKFTGTTLYGKAEDAKAAGEAEAAEKGEQVGDIEVTNQVTYTATASYIPEFTVTIDVEGWTDKQYYNELFQVDASHAAKDIANKAIDYYVNRLVDNGYTITGSSSSVVAEDYDDIDPYKDLGLFDIKVGEGYRAKEGSTISLTFTKLVEAKKQVPLNTWKMIGESLDPLGWFHDTNNEEIDNAKKIASEYIKSQNGFENGTEWFNWNDKTATAYYYLGTVASVTGTSDNQQSAEAAARASLQSDLANNVAYKNSDLEKILGTVKSYSTSVYKGKQRVNTSYGVQYGYKGEYQTTDEDQLISTTTTTYETETLAHLTGEYWYGNDNYLAYLANPSDDSTITMFEAEGKKDLGLNDFLNDYKTKKSNYETLASKAKDAAAAYAAAEQKVKDLTAALDNLNNQATTNGVDAQTIAKQTELTVALTQAQADMDQAAATLKGITDQLAGLLVSYNAKIASLTPAPINIVAAAEAAPTPVAAAGGAGFIAAAPVETPLVQQTLDNENPVSQLSEQEDIQTALSDITLADETEANSILGWWWLLFIAIAGGTGYTIYRKYQQRKAVNKVDKK